MTVLTVEQLDPKEGSGPELVELILNLVDHAREAVPGIDRQDVSADPERTVVQVLTTFADSAAVVAYAAAVDVPLRKVMPLVRGWRAEAHGEVDQAARAILEERGFRVFERVGGFSR